MSELDPDLVRSYRPGGWFAVLGPQVTVLLPPSQQARVAGIWELVLDGAGFDLTLDALIAEGIRDCRPSRWSPPRRG